VFEIPLQYLGNGQFNTVSRAGAKVADAECEKGETFRAQFTRYRSIDQNNFFHGLIDAVFNTLTDEQAEEFTDPRHLKEWLLIEAGHIKEDRIALGKSAPERKAMKPVVEAMTASLRRQRQVIKVLYNEKRHELIIRYAGEWRFSKLDHDRATEITQRVVEIICDRLLPGSTPENVFEVAERYTNKLKRKVK
jgi:hypothetical protein